MKYIDNGLKKTRLQLSYNLVKLLDISFVISLKYYLVNRYVIDISVLDKRSRNCKNPVKQWDKPTYASKELNINLAEIVSVAKCELCQAGGFGLKYVKSENKKI